MAIRIKVQKDYLRTEASIELPADIGQVDEIMRSTKATGKLVVLYYDGHHQGINIEQNSKIPERKAGEIRAMLDVEDKQL
jgi:hypothetical protein